MERLDRQAPKPGEKEAEQGQTTSRGRGLTFFSFSDEWRRSQDFERFPLIETYLSHL